MFSSELEEEFRYALLALAHRVSTLCHALLAFSLKNPETTQQLSNR
jgi:hypothetical protein